VNTRIRVFAMAVLALALIALVACAASQPTPAPTSLAPTAMPLPPTPTPAPLQVTDDLGKTLTMDVAPQKIVSLAPSVTEILFAIGAGSKVVGVQDFSNYPPEAAESPQVGGFPLNYELIASLQPDLCIGADITSPDDIAKLEDLGLKVMVVNRTDLEGIFANIELVGKAVGMDKSANDLAAFLRAELKTLQERIQTVTTNPRVFVELDETLYTVAPGSFIHPLVEIAGGANIAADSTNPYPQFSAEQIIARDPEVIILTDAAYGVTAEQVKARPGWEAITAVKNGAVHPIDGDIISRPGPRILQGLQALVSLIHPELK
jgi:iron complex transport system substrate-binding protein